MKATVKYTDGKIVELDGTQEELVIVLRQFVGYSWPIDTLPLWTYSICQHEYPQPWNGIVPPNCTKCGMAAATSYFTCTTS